MVKNTEASSGLMKQLQLEDGSTVAHKYKRGVTGEIKILHGDFCVKWSDGDGQFTWLHAGDVGKIS